MGVLVVEPGERARLLELARTARESSWLTTSKNEIYVQYEREAVMVDQLRFMLELARRRHVTLQVFCGSSSYQPGLGGPFVILDFPQLPPIVFLEQYQATGYLYAEDQVADYRSAAKKSAALSLSEQDSCALIREVIAELGGPDA